MSAEDLQKIDVVYRTGETEPPGSLFVPTGPGSTPVFVDSTGRRQRRVRRLAKTGGLLSLAYTALVGVSLLGGSTIIPLSPGQDQPSAAQPVAPPVGPSQDPTRAQPSPAASRDQAVQLAPGAPDGTDPGPADRPSSGPTTPSGGTAAPIPEPTTTSPQAPPTLSPVPTGPGTSPPEETDPSLLDDLLDTLDIFGILDT